MDTTDEFIHPLDLERGPQPWQQRSACRDEDPNLFYPNGVTGAAAEQEQEAKAICANCPVSGECLDYALLWGERYGVWGGLNEHERRAFHPNSKKKGMSYGTSRLSY